MAVPTQIHRRRPHPLTRLLLWVIPALFILLIVGFFVAKAAVDAYLRSSQFREFVARKAGETLHADTELAPLAFTGGTVFSNGFQAKGAPDAAFSEMDLEQIRTEISLRRFFEKVWQIEQFEAQRIRLDLSGPRVQRPLEPNSNPLSAPKNEDSSTGWLPNRVEIGHATIHDTQLTWKAGGLRGTALEMEPHEGGWQISGQGGHLSYEKLPELDVKSLRLRYRSPTLYLSSSEFRVSTGGGVEAAGEIDFTRQLDLRLKLVNTSISPFLSEDWRLRAKGNVSGEVTVQAALPLTSSPRTTGSLQVTQGELTALPVLDEIAIFTRTQQFRRLNLNRASGSFVQDANRLDVTKFVAESDGLIRVEGAFSIQNGAIDGNFQVGVTPSSLQWLPGSQAKVFTESRGGYLWSPMHLSGPVNKPSEDLTPRLVAAAQGAVIEGVQNAAGEAVKSGKEVIKGALDLLLPPAK